MRAKIVFALLGVSVLAFLWTQPSPGKMSSASYEVITEVFDNGGSTSSSATKLNTAAIGQSTPIGFGSSSSYENSAGFIPQLPRAAHADCPESCDVVCLQRCIAMFLDLLRCDPCVDSDEDGECDIVELQSCIAMFLGLWP